MNQAAKPSISIKQKLPTFAFYVNCFISVKSRFKNDSYGDDLKQKVATLKMYY